MKKIWETLTTTVILLLSAEEAACVKEATHAHYHLFTLFVTCLSSCSLKVQLGFIKVMMGIGLKQWLHCWINENVIQSVEHFVMVLSFFFSFLEGIQHCNPLSYCANIIEINSYFSFSCSLQYDCFISGNNVLSGKPDLPLWIVFPYYYSSWQTYAALNSSTELLTHQCISASQQGLDYFHDFHLQQMSQTQHSYLC